MNFFQILSDIEKVDPEVYERLDSRRQVFKHMSGVGQKLTAAALPLFVGAVFNKAYAQTNAGLAVQDVLNFALKLEYLEMYFYQQRTALTGISATNMTALQTIATDEANHVTFLKSAIGAISGAVVFADPTVAAYDFSGGKGTGTGPFADWRTNPATYLALAQSFEDTGVRAYKGAAPLASVMANKTVLTAALNIHSVEARHASHIRSMRRAGVNSSTPSQGVPVAPYGAQPKSWISGTDNGGAAPTYTAPIYGAGNNTGTAVYGNGTGSGVGTATGVGVTFPAEDNVTQGGVPLSTSTSANFANFPTASFSEAFDEGLDVGTVSAIARTFVVTGNTMFG
ncbi:ferritin-like domain-containing protein [Hymenobacter sp. RP-2-7]|uniref:Ferritin-like domain-containing protein n=1 Tax=Hymenobacter polaris TaxID=2682546 RepID=A0A7Y0AHI3_9BACT|nr:ferritin-like domain-containing protein [Hymenobacter polaris]NML67389.1 ferritin-like domain-containing protein [Hymenobacter polaris]